MTTISQDDVLNLARLSSLELDDDEIASLSDNLARTLEYVEQLNDLDTSGVEPTYMVNDPSNVFRDDAVRESLTGQSLVSLAPKSRDNQIEVPKVL